MRQRTSLSASVLTIYLLMAFRNGKTVIQQPGGRIPGVCQMWALTPSIHGQFPMPRAGHHSGAVPRL